MRLQLAKALLSETFEHFRRCGRGRRECQVVWVGPLDSPTAITRLVHLDHSASMTAFELTSSALDALWDDLAATGSTLRVQVHTHPGAAFHSATDDAYPISFRCGFLSLVIPNFAAGPVGFNGADLAQVNDQRQWRQVSIAEHLEVVDAP